MKKIVNKNGYGLMKKENEYYITDFPNYPNQNQKSKELFQSLERLILKEKFIYYPTKFNITERVVLLCDNTSEYFSFLGIKKLIDKDKSLFIDTNTFFKIKISFVGKNTELKIIYYTIDNDKGLIDCKSSEMMLNIIFINYNIKQFTEKRIDKLTNEYNLDFKEIKQIPLIPVQWLNFDENGNLMDFPNFKLGDKKG
jgi:hypothetical protein